MLSLAKCIQENWILLKKHWPFRNAWKIRSLLPCVNFNVCIETFHHQPSKSKLLNSYRDEINTKCTRSSWRSASVLKCALECLQQPENMWLIQGVFIAVWILAINLSATRSVQRHGTIPQPRNVCVVIACECTKQLSWADF